MGKTGWGLGAVWQRRTLVRGGRIVYILKVALMGFAGESGMGRKWRGSWP